LAAAISGYVSLNVAAFFTAIELGLQPMLHHTASGSPLYAPFPLIVTIPAMMTEHAFIFGFVEAAATAFLVSYVMRSDLSVLATSMVHSIPGLNTSAGVGGSQMISGQSQAQKRSVLRRMWILVVVLIVLTPLGLLAPGTAFGEWSSSDLQEMFGMSPPVGLVTLENLYNAPFKDYSVAGATTFIEFGLVYVFTAVIGVSILGVCLFLLYRVRSRAMVQDP
jgi:cobalt/nickel transport system permease protein